MRKMSIAFIAAIALTALPSRAAAQSEPQPAAARQIAPPNLRVDFGAGLKPKPAATFRVTPPAAPSTARLESQAPMDCQMMRAANPDFDPKMIGHPMPGREFFIRVVPAPKCPGW